MKNFEFHKVEGVIIVNACIISFLSVHTYRKRYPNLEMLNLNCHFYGSNHCLRKNSLFLVVTVTVTATLTVMNNCEVSRCPLHNPHLLIFRRQHHHKELEAETS